MGRNRCCLQTGLRMCLQDGCSCSTSKCNKVNNKKNSHVSGYYGNYYGSYYGGRIKHEKHRCRVRKIKYASAYCKPAVLCFVEGLYQGAFAQCHGCLQCAFMPSHMEYTLFLSFSIIISIYSIFKAKSKYLKLLLIFFTITMITNLFFNNRKNRSVYSF